MGLRINPLRFVPAAVLFTDLLSRTLRFSQQGLDHCEQLRDQGAKFVVAFWHDELFPLIHLHRDQGVVAVVSQSQDGEFLSQVMARFGFYLARGSSRRGGAGALIAARTLFSRWTAPEDPGTRSRKARSTLRPRLGHTWCLCVFSCPGPLFFTRPGTDFSCPGRARCAAWFTASPIASLKPCRPGNWPGSAAGWKTGSMP